MIRKRGSILLLTLLLAATSASSGCIGRMAVSGEVRKFNLAVADNKWGREVVFLVLYIIPVYPIAGAIDLLIVNSIEFHTGTNPVSDEERLARAGDTHEVTGADGTRVVSTLRADGSIDLEITGPGGETHFTNVARTQDGTVARDADGRTLAVLEAGEVRLAFE